MKYGAGDVGPMLGTSMRERRVDGKDYTTISEQFTGVDLVTVSWSERVFRRGGATSGPAASERFTGVAHGGWKLRLIAAAVHFSVTCRGETP